MTVNDSLINIESNSGRGLRVSRLHLQGISKPYVVDFREDFKAPRTLSIIAGPVSTGKSTVLEFIQYALGGRKHPTHPEVLAQVTSCLLEILIFGDSYVIQRAVGRPSTTAAVFSGDLEAVFAGDAIGMTRAISPAGHPDSLSSFLLASVGLEGVQLKEAPTQDESGADPLSIRDLFWLCYMPNERLDDKNLLFESAPMKSLKLRQVIEVIFGIHDHRRAELGDRIKAAQADLSSTRSDLLSARKFVEEQETRSAEHLEVARDLALIDIEDAQGHVARVLDQINRATEFADQLRSRHQNAAQYANRTAGEVRDRQTLLRRLTPLRAQYSEDVRKLAMLVEAHTLFDPLHVTSCPACFTKLTDSPALIEHKCSLCGSELPDGWELNLGGATNMHVPAAEEMGDEDELDMDTNDSEYIAPNTESGRLVSVHLRATRSRLNELNKYIDSVEEQLEGLTREMERAKGAEVESAHALDHATIEIVTPFLAERDELMKRREIGQERINEIDRGLKLYAGLQSREASVGRLESKLDVLREQFQALGDLDADKNSVLGSVSERYADILRQFNFPKLDRPFVNSHWEPFVRDSSYRAASSGARTLLSLAWILAIYEVAVERGYSHPGLLIIDSPQKNIGTGSDSDGEFADAAVVEGIYEHLHRWSAAFGNSSQMIVVDNDPPTIASGDVILRFTRDPEIPLYGLIDNEVSRDVSVPSKREDGNA